MVSSSYANIFVGIIPDVFTDPKELAFEAFNPQFTSEKCFYFIQPAVDGSIVAYLGPHKSTHFYKMPSVSVFLNTHIVFMHKSQLSPLYALCSIENNFLIAQQNSIILCSFRVSLLSFHSHIFTNSSCIIRAVNESECAAKLDINFVQLQFNFPVTVLVTYNVTAYQLNQTYQYIEKPDITNSLIHSSQTIPPVTVIHKSEFEWHTILENDPDTPFIQIGVPSLRTNQEFPLRIAANASSEIQGFKIELIFGSNIRYQWQERVQNPYSRLWRVKVTPNQYGAVVKARYIKSSTNANLSQILSNHINERGLVVITDLIMEHLEMESYLSDLDGTNSLHHSPLSSFGPRQSEPDSDFEYFMNLSDKDYLSSNIQDKVADSIGDQTFSTFSQHDNAGGKAKATNMHFNAFGSKSIIQVRMKYFVRAKSKQMMTKNDKMLTKELLDVDANRTLNGNKLSTNLTKVMTDSSMNVVNFVTPQIINPPNAVHIFVQFEPKDMLEPPWFPAIPPPGPRKLRIMGLVVQQDTDNNYHLPFETRSAGHLIDLTRDVHCRPSTGSHFGSDLILDLGVLSSRPSCPITMRQAPKDLESLESYPNSLIAKLKPTMLTKSAGGLGQRFDWSDQLILGLYEFRSTSSNPSTAPPHPLPSAVPNVPSHYVPIMPSIYGPIQLESEWLWRDWRGPTVRRWMLEGFQIHVTQTKLSKIHMWRVPFHTITTEKERKAYVNSHYNLFANKSTDVIDRFEQTPITVTAKIYTKRPGTGQRIYLGPLKYDHRSNMDFAQLDDYASQTSEEEHTSFDVTRLLPSWALVVKSVSNYRSPKDALPKIPAAYVHRDVFTNRPHLIGRWSGLVELSLVATLGDLQPLTKIQVEVIDSEELPLHKQKSNLLNIVAIKAECVDHNLKLAGHLSPAQKSAGETSFKKQNSKIPYFQDNLVTIQDYSWPNPHRLTMELVGSSSNLITASASSTVKNSKKLRMNLLKLKSKFNSINTIDRSSSSSVTCPLHLLVTSLILSDGTILGTHNVPKNHLRISSYGTKYVWDPAMPIGDSKVNLTNAHYNLSVPINSIIIWPASNLGTQTGLVDVANLPLGMMDSALTQIEQTGMIEDPGTVKNLKDWIVDLDESDDVALPDDGFTKKDKFILTNQSPWSQSNSIFYSSDSSRLYNSRPTPIVTYVLIGVGCVAVFLFFINCVVVIYLRKRRSNRQKNLNMRNQPYSQDAGSLDDCDALKNHRNAQMNNYMIKSNYSKKEISETTLLMNGNMKPLEFTNHNSIMAPVDASPPSAIHHKNNNNNNNNNFKNKKSNNLFLHGTNFELSGASPHCINRSLAMFGSASNGGGSGRGGLSCSSIGSGNSAQLTNFNKSIHLGDSNVNSYFGCSDASPMSNFPNNTNSNLSQYSCLPNFSPLCASQNPINNCQSINPSFGTCNSDWESAAPYNKSSCTPNHDESTNLNMCQNCNLSHHCCMWSQNNNIITNLHHNLCNGNGTTGGGYTSGLGSAGTTEGCSDEGVASGIEVNSLSQDLSPTNGCTMNYFNASGQFQLSNVQPSHHHHHHHQQQQHNHQYNLVNKNLNSGGGHNSATNSVGSANAIGPVSKHLLFTFKPSPTGALSLNNGGNESISGTSSGAETSDYRPSRLGPDSNRPYAPTKLCTKQNLNASPVIMSNNNNNNNHSHSNYNSDENSVGKSKKTSNRSSVANDGKMSKSILIAAPHDDANNDFILSHSMKNSHFYGQPNPNMSSQIDDECSDSCLMNKVQSRENSGNDINETCAMPIIVPPMMNLLDNCLKNTKTFNDNQVNYKYNSTCLPQYTNYKRSDSFGMATNRVEPYRTYSNLPESVLYTNNNNNNNSGNGNNKTNFANLMSAGAIDQIGMIGDESDTLDSDTSNNNCINNTKLKNVCEHSSPSLAKNAIDRTKSMIVESNENDITYLYKIPPPEV